MFDHIVVREFHFSVQCSLSDMEYFVLGNNSMFKSESSSLPLTVAVAS